MTEQRTRSDIERLSLIKPLRNPQTNEIELVPMAALKPSKPRHVTAEQREAEKRVAYRQIALSIDVDRPGWIERHERALWIAAGLACVGLGLLR